MHRARLSSFAKCMVASAAAASASGVSCILWSNSDIHGFHYYKDRLLDFKLSAATNSVADKIETERVLSETENDMKLVGVHIFLRHGARIPLQHLPPSVPAVVYDAQFLGRIPPHTNFPIEVKDLKTWGPRPLAAMQDRYRKTVFEGGMISGSLTTRGREQMYQLGLRLRESYMCEKNFLSAEFNMQDIHVQSTNIDRCIESLQCVLAGIYSAKALRQQGMAIARNSITIPVLSSSEEYLYPNLLSCPTLRHLESEVRFMLEKNPQYMETLRKVQEATGDNSFQQLIRWRDHLVARLAHGLFVPDWVMKLESEIIQGAIMSLKEYVCGGEKHRHIVLSLATGRIFSQLIENMEMAARDPNSGKKLYLFSCHDTSLFPMLEALGEDMDHWPPYAADLRFELYQDSDKNCWVKTIYCSKPITLQGHAEPLISLEDFRKIVQPYRLTQAEFDCRCNDLDEAKEHARFWEAVAKTKGMPAIQEAEKDTEVAPPMM